MDAEEVEKMPHSRSGSRSRSPQNVNGLDSHSPEPEAKSRKIRSSKREHKTREKTSRRSKDSDGSKRKDKGKTKESKKSATSEKIIEPENPPVQVEEYSEDMQQIDTEQQETPVPEESHRRDSSPEKEDVELEQVEKPQKKRRWGLTRGISEKSVKVSSDMLKDIIPDVKPLDASEVKLDETEAVEEAEEEKSEKQQRREKLREERRAAKIALDEAVLEEHEEVRQEEMEDVSDREEEVENSERKVVVALDNTGEDGVEDSGVGRRVSVVDDSSVPRLTIRRQTTPPPVQPARHRLGTTVQPPPPASRNPSSNLVIIKNLVRPFTVVQLKELLERTGTIEENGFWIDKIKSCCLVKFSEESQAAETRLALHGAKWPVSNPKTLLVDFTSDAEFAYHQSHGDEVPPPRPIQRDTVQRGDRGGFNNRREDNFNRRQRNFDEDNLKGKRIREWDIAKIGERSPGERERERERKKEREERDRERDRERVRRERDRSRSTSQHRRRKQKENTPPAKVLEDLFRKTTTVPCIYWLPLTLEQIAEKEKARRNKMQERDRIIAELAAGDGKKSTRRSYSPGRDRRR